MPTPNNRSVRTRRWRRHQANPEMVETVFQTLKEERRRLAIDYLLGLEPDAIITKGDIARGVAALENDVRLEDVTSTQRNNVLSSMETYHLNQLYATNVIEAGPDRGIRRGSNAEAISCILDGTRLLAGAALK